MNVPKIRWRDLFASYNPRTKKIHNCTKGTLIWYHEKRHEWQDKKGLLATAFASMEFSITITTFVTLFYRPFWVMFPLGWVFRILIIEIDAWIYSLKKIKEIKKK